MKLIPLTQNKFAQVDDEDFERLNQYKWFLFKPKESYTRLYAMRDEGVSGKRKRIRMHRFVLNCNKKLSVDHKDGNGLNNQI